MPTYLLHLGREPQISVAEIEAYCLAEGLDIRAPRLVGGALEFSAEEPIDPARMIRRLGGAIRIARKIASLDGDVSPSELTDIIYQNLRQNREGPQRKRPFGLSWLGVLPSTSVWKTDSISRSVKEMARKEGESLRFVLPQKGDFLSCAAVVENQIIERGAEFVLAGGPGEIVLGATLAVQSYQEDADRDMNKPDRRVYEGLLPPKLARVLVNLARTGDTKTLIDPFCGSGVLLMEGLGLGLEVYGFDSDQGAVEASRKNVEWFVERMGIDRPRHIRAGDSRDLSTFLPPLSLDAAAAEPYMGPPLRKSISVDRARKAAMELRDLYVRVLAELRIVLKPGSRCVFITPLFSLGQGDYPVSIEKDLPMIGYKTRRMTWNVEGMPEIRELVHRRPGQKVARKIHLLEA